MKKSVKIAIAVIVVLAIIAIICVAVMTTTGGKKAITIEEFDAKAKELGYIMSEVQNSTTDEEEITGSKAAIKEDYSYLVIFYTLKDNDAANSFYNKQKENYEKSKQEGTEAVEKSGKNYETYTLKSDSKYMYVARVDNTVVQLSVNEESEQEVSAFIQKLGY